jgi:hypothetical protein
MRLWVLLRSVKLTAIGNNQIISFLPAHPHARRVFASSFSTGPPGDRRTSLPLVCHRNATNRTRSRFKHAAFYHSLKSKVGFAAAKAAALRINLNVEGCGIVAAPVHAPPRAPLVLPLQHMSSTIPLPPREQLQ